MNPHTGAIAQFENEEDAKAAGHTVPVPADEVDRLLLMNRAERRAWARARGSKHVPTMEELRRGIL